jgi:hypothetical protein
LYKSWSSGVGRGHNRGKYIHIEKIFFSQPISMKLGTNLPWVKRIKNCSIEGPGSFPRGDNQRNAKIRWGHLKSSSQEPQSQRSSYLQESFLI